MRVVIVADYDAISKTAASIIAEEITAKRYAVLGLATGSTPLGTYMELIRMHNDEGLDFSQVRTFNLDEYYRLDPNHPQSYHAFMYDNFFDRVNIKIENIHIPDGMAKDVALFCKEYEALIKQVGGIDLQLLGIGRDGHLGFNEPGSSLGSRTRLKTLTKETVKDNARFFTRDEEVPKLAITMGVGTILEARKLVLIANGEQKAPIVRDAIEGPLTSQVTASAIQLHPHVTVVIDEPASKMLRRKDYYKYVEEVSKSIGMEARI